MALPLAWWHLHNQLLRSSITDLTEYCVDGCKLVVVDWHLLKLHHLTYLFNSIFCSWGVAGNFHCSKAILYTFGIFILYTEPSLLYLFSELFFSIAVFLLLLCLQQAGYVPQIHHMLVVCIVLLSSDSLCLLVLLLSHQCFLLALLKFIFQVFQIALHLSELKLLLQLLLFFLLHLFFESLLIVDGSHNCVDFVFHLQLCFALPGV